MVLNYGNIPTYFLNISPKQQHIRLQKCPDFRRLCEQVSDLFRAATKSGDVCCCVAVLPRHKELVDKQPKSTI